MAEKLKISEKTIITTSYAKTDNIIEDIRTIIQSARSGAYDALNAVIIRKNWLIGKRIVEEEQQGSDRAEYGAHIISELSKNLTSDEELRQEIEVQKSIFFQQQNDRLQETGDEDE